MLLRKLILTCLLLTGVQVLHAETKTEYAIDFVVFEDSEARYLGSEQWPVVEYEADNDPAATAYSPQPRSRLKPDIRKIRTADFDLLDNEVNRLLNSRRYKVLARSSWLQPGLDNLNAVDIELIPNAQSSSAGSISGSIKIVLERYLHIYTNLIYRNPSLSPASETEVVSPGVVHSTAGQGVAYAIQEHRRMRSRELHYIDHPLVGMLVKIVPVETEITDDTNPAQSALPTH